MDVTPNNKMFHSMKTFVDGLVGPEPEKLNVTPDATRTRHKRVLAFDFLHQLVAVSMREGVNRAILEAKKRRDDAYRFGPKDKEDRDAAAKAVDDAHSGASIIRLPGA